MVIRDTEVTMIKFSRCRSHTLSALYMTIPKSSYSTNGMHGDTKTQLMEQITINLQFLCQDRKSMYIMNL